MLELTLLGSPEVQLHGNTVTGFRSSKAQALLYYLAVARRPVQRGVLVTLFWAEQDEGQARVNLNQTISNVRKLVGDYVEADRQTVRFNRDLPHTVDVERFAGAARQATQAAPADLESAAHLYRGDFLEGFFVRDTAEFETWLAAERAHLRETAIYLYSALGRAHAARGDLVPAADALRRVLRIEPWREQQHRDLMVLLAQNGQRSAALAQFEACRQALAVELDVEPSPETVALAEQIRNGTVAAPPAPPQREVKAAPASVPAETPPAVAPPRRAASHNLPAENTPFVGRGAECARIVQQVCDPACRLLTLTGPGGIGKSRLALQIARTIADDGFFADGVLFVALAAIDTADAIVPAMAQAAGFHFYDNASPRQQMIDYLREKRLLLVLDNMEHLLDGLDLVEEILGAAPGVRFLVTSRASLNLVEEWFVPVGGLFVPAADRPASQPTAEFDAVKLFVQSARRAQAGFALTGVESHVVRICQLVDGTPLAIELAAAWLRVLPVEQIAREIEQSLDILTARHQNIPARHRSMRAIFEASWRLLPSEQRASMRRLAVCPSGFEVDAARAIADASIFDLAMLLEKSFLRHDEDGRYTMHPLMRQYALDRLAAHGETEEARRQHSAWYLELLVTRSGSFTGSAQRDALMQVEVEAENVRTAWLWAVEQADWPAINRAAPALYEFLQIRSRYGEGQELFARAVERAAATSQPFADPLLADCCLRLRVWLGAFRFLLSDYAGAAAILEETLAASTAAGLDAESALATNLLGQIAGWSGDRLEARRQLEASCAICRRTGDMLGLANALHKLAQIHGSFGEYAEARALAEESLHLCQRYGRADWTGYALDVLGWATVCLGDYMAAEAHYLASLTVFQESGDRLGTALALGGLGSVGWARGDSLDGAMAYMEESLTLCRAIGHRHHASSRLWYMAQIANDRGDFRAAQRHAREGLAIAESVGSRVFMSYNLSALGDAAIGLGDFAVGQRYLVAVLRTASEVEHLPPIMIALVSLGRLWLGLGRNWADDATRDRMQQRAIAALTLASRHPACWHVYRTRAERTLIELGAEAPGELFSAAAADGSTRAVGSMVASLLADPPADPPVSP